MITTNGDNGQIVAIGHFLNDEWFNPSDAIKAMRADGEGGAR